MRRATALTAVLTALALTASACHFSGAAAADRGGTLTITAQEPFCADPLLPCSSNRWGGAYPTMTVQTIPHVLDIDQGRYVPSPLLAAPPILQPGPPQRVIYQINPKAVWSDGQPITSSDFRFTWQSVIHEPMADPTGYNQVQSIDDSRPRTAVVTFSSPYSDWQDLFGKYPGVLPKHILEGHDRDAEMKDGYPWSGGPWLIQSWTKGKSIVLVPNRRYWGPQPKLDRVVFLFVTDYATEEQLYRTGQVDVIAPPGRQFEADLRNLPNTNFAITPSLIFEMLAFNMERPPLNDKAVRQALAYATDRGAIGEAVFPVEPDLVPIDSFIGRASPYYVTPFSRYRRDLSKVDQIMEGDGWTRGAGGIWTRDGQPAKVDFTTFDLNPVGRAAIEDNLIRAQWREAGFDVTAEPSTSDAMFQDLAPNGHFSAITYVQLPPTFSPADCAIWCSENITPNGANFPRLRDPTVDDLYHKIGSELDDTRRRALVAQVQAVLADEVPGLPIGSPPDVIYWRTSVAGPIGPNNPFGPFVNLNQWYCKKGRCHLP
jgi:peptide/nickel transport system substrate-binding protein